jgi:hypothetical protein
MSAIVQGFVVTLSEREMYAPGAAVVDGKRFG